MCNISLLAIEGIHPLLAIYKAKYNVNVISLKTLNINQT
jgi:hypothetical protein